MLKKIHWEYIFAQLLIFLFLIHSSFAQSNSQVGWTALVNHQITAADTTFKESLKLKANLRDALLGESILSIYKGGYDSAFEDYQQIVLSEPDNLENEAYFRRMSEFQNVSKEYPKLKQTYEKLIQYYSTHKTEHPYLATLAKEYLTKIYYETGEFQKAKSLENSLGYLNQWDFVIGPFGKTGISDLHRIFPFEKDITQTSYPGWIHPVSKRKISQRLFLNELDMSDYIYPAQGTAYAVSRMNINKETPGWLGLKTDSLGKIWVNGKVVLIRDVYQAYQGGASWAPVHLEKGENLIVVKLTARFGNLSFRLQLLDNSGSPISAAIHSPNRPVTPSVTSLSPSQTAVSYMHPTFSYANDSSGELTAQLTRSMLSIVNRNFGEGEEIIRALQKQYPNWGYPNLLLGDLYLRQAQEQPQSSLRLNNQAKELFEKAKSQMPDVLGSYRGLGWYYIRQRQYDTALDYARQAEKMAPNSYLIPSLLGEIYSARDWYVEMVEALAKSTSLNPRYVQGYLGLANQKDRNGLDKEAEALYRYIYQLDQSDAYALDKLRSNLDQQGKHTESAKLLEKYFSSIPMDFQDCIDVAETYEQLNQPEKAKQYYAQATSLNPDHPTGYEHLAEFELRHNNQNQAIDLFQEAIQRSPNRDDLRDRVRILTRKKEFYEPYDIAFESVDTTGYDSIQYPRAAVIFFLDLMVTEYHQDGSSRSMIHQALKILNKQGRERFEELTVPSNAKIIYARTITKDGKIYKPTLITQTSSGKAISMYAVEEGAILDYCYVFSDDGGRSPGNNYSQGLYYFQEKEDPMALSRSVYIVPDGIFFEYRDHPVDFQPTVTSITTDIPEKVYVWENRKSPGIKEEPFMPPMEDVATTMFQSTYPDWEIVISSILEAIEQNLMPSPWVSERTNSLLSSARTEKEKIQRIYDFITQKIVSGSSPGATVTDTLIVGSGSSYDKTLLAKAMLDEAGIDSEIILISPGEIPETRAGIPLPGQYSRPILHLLKSVEDIEYLDFSSQYRALGQIPDYLQEKDAIRLSSAGFSFFTMPDYTLAHIDRSHRISITVMKDSTCNVKGEIKYFEDNAVSFRDYLNDPIRKKRVLDEEINRLFRGIEISTSAWNGLDDLNQPVSLVFEGKVTNFLIPREDGFNLSPILDKLNLSRLVPSPERQYPLHFNSNIAHNDFEIELNLPEGLSMSEIPSNMLEISPYGNYQLHWTALSERNWIGKRSVLIPKLKVDTKKYPDFVDFCQKIDTAEKLQLHLIWSK